jgi:hypothetical protein
VPGCAPRAPLLPSAFDTAQLFAGTVRFGQAQGDIRPDVNADVAGRLLLDAYLGILYRWVADTDGDNSTSLLDRMMAMLDLALTGIGQAPRWGRPVRRSRRRSVFAS